MHCSFHFCLLWTVNTGLHHSAGVSAHEKIPSQHPALLLALHLHAEHDMYRPSLLVKLLMLRESIAETHYLELLLSIAALMLACDILQPFL